MARTLAGTRRKATEMKATDNARVHCAYAPACDTRAYAQRARRPAPAYPYAPERMRPLVCTHPYVPGHARTARVRARPQAPRQAQARQGP